MRKCQSIFERALRKIAVTLFILNVMLSLAWAALTGYFTPTNLVIGFVLGYAMLWIAQRKESSSVYFRKVRLVIGFAIFFVLEVIKANLRVAYEVLTPGHQMMPGVVAIPLDARTDAEITILANLITLTPGTLSLDVSTDRSVLFIHAMYVENVIEFKQQIKQGLERRLLEVLR
jgi:multicomponent Na+:H+ antiporter subunit E